MNKTHHPADRAERLRIKAKKDRRDSYEAAYVKVYKEAFHGKKTDDPSEEGLPRLSISGSDDITPDDR